MLPILLFMNEYLALWEAHGIDDIGRSAASAPAARGPTITKPSPERKTEPVASAAPLAAHSGGIALMLVCEDSILDPQQTQLLEKILEAMGYRRDAVVIELVSSTLEARIEEVKPRLVVAFGEKPAVYVTGQDSTLGLLRRQFHPLYCNKKIPVLVTYPPSFLLQNPTAKKTVWEDMKMAMKLLAN